MNESKRFLEKYLVTRPAGYFDGCILFYYGEYGRGREGGLQRSLALGFWDLL